VKDGKEALDFVFAKGKFAGTRSILHPPRLLILDINMPKINGIEVLTKIKSDERTKSIPVVMLTSSNNDPHISQCYRLGAISYIVKPLEFESFTSVIKHIGFSWLLLKEPCL
jgi:two-component system response regulator